MRFKRLIYKWGFRPNRGSVFFSPSLHMIYAGIDNWPDLRDKLSGRW